MIEFPRLVDLHTHTRFPGLDDGILKESLAAKAGGYETICVMPNTNPVVDNVEIVQKIKEKIKRDAVVNVKIISAVTKGQKGKELVDFESLMNEDITMFSDDGKCVDDINIMRKALQLSEKHGFVIAQHAEDTKITNGAVLDFGPLQEKYNLKGGWIDKAEVRIIKRDIDLLKEVGGNLHVCHVSCAKSVELIRDAKKQKLNITAEVTPHHLLWNVQNIFEKGKSNALYKMNPPLRTTVDNKALLSGLIDGTIDCIATDHAPHLKKYRDSDFNNAPFGITGLEIAFSLIYNSLVKNGNLTLSELENKMVYNPCKIGKIKHSGKTFSFVPAKKWVYNKTLSNGENNPLFQNELIGKII